MYHQTIKEADGETTLDSSTTLTCTPSGPRACWGDMASEPGAGRTGFWIASFWGSRLWRRNRPRTGKRELLNPCRPAHLSRTSALLPN